MAVLKIGECSLTLLSLKSGIHVLDGDDKVQQKKHYVILKARSEELLMFPPWYLGGFAI